MQQIAIINYETGSIDIYPYPNDYNGYVEDWILENKLSYNDSNCYWIHRHGIIPLTIHDRLPEIN